MQAIHDTAIGLVSEQGSLGMLHIACLGEDLEWKAGIPYLVDVGEESEGGQAIQLLEESEYRYWIDGVADGSVSLQPSEIFSQDDANSGTSGRLKTGRFVGTVSVTAEVEGGTGSGKTAFEVRSRKLDYLSPMVF